MRFTIRDLLWLTTLAAVCAAWTFDRRQQHAEQERLTNTNNRWSMMFRGYQSIRPPHPWESN